MNRPFARPETPHRHVVDGPSAPAADQFARRPFLQQSPSRTSPRSPSLFPVVGRAGIGPDVTMGPSIDLDGLMGKLVVAPNESPALDFSEFFEREHLRLGRAIYLLTGDRAEAEELVQDALARAYERWERVSRMSEPAGYVYRIASNLHKRRMRWRRRLATDNRRCLLGAPRSCRNGRSGCRPLGGARHADARTARSDRTGRVAGFRRGGRGADSRNSCGFGSRSSASSPSEAS